MITSLNILRLYSEVFYSEIFKNGITEERLRSAMKNIERTYLPHQPGIVELVDYNDCSNRCAYLHKYAPFHTEMAYSMMHRVLTFYLDFPLNSPFTVCSLGGGPGADVIGVLAALYEKFGLHFSATVVDIMPGWNETFQSILSAIKFGNYGTFDFFLRPNRFKFSFMASNIFKRDDNKVTEAIGSADLVTIVKFVSASSADNNLNIHGMLKEVFESMKVGAHLLFIDNAAGGYLEAVLKVADECRLICVFGPLHHEIYENEWFSMKRFGFESCYSTKLSVVVMKKLFRLPRTGLIP